MSKTERKTTSPKSTRSTAKRSSTKRAATKSVRAKAKKSASKKTATRSSSRRTTSTKKTKTATKKSSTKTTKEKPQKNTDHSPTVTLPEYAFWVNDGVVLHSLKELEQALHVMDELVYRYHVNQDKHDFADWVEYVLSDVKCAKELRKADTLAQARTIIITHLKRYHQ